MKRILKFMKWLVAIDGSSQRVDKTASDYKIKKGFIFNLLFVSKVMKLNKKTLIERRYNTISQLYPISKINIELITTVVGIIIGTRGTIPSFFIKFTIIFRLSKSLLDKITIAVIKNSLVILIHHLNNSS